MARKKKLLEKAAHAAEAFKKKLARLEKQEESEEATVQEEERVPDPKKDAGYFDAQGVFRRAK